MVGSTVNEKAPPRPSQTGVDGTSLVKDALLAMRKAAMVFRRNGDDLDGDIPAFVYPQRLAERRP
jgi:hypothetical protein